MPEVSGQAVTNRHLKMFRIILEYFWERKCRFFLYNCCQLFSKACKNTLLDYRFIKLNVTLNLKLLLWMLSLNLKFIFMKICFMMFLSGNTENSYAFYFSNNYWKRNSFFLILILFRNQKLNNFCWSINNFFMFSFPSNKIWSAMLLVNSRTK